MDDTEKELVVCYCGGIPEIVDVRTYFLVKCPNLAIHAEYKAGENVTHLDHLDHDLVLGREATDEEADALSDEAFSKVDWGHLKQTAITNWNTYITDKKSKLLAQAEFVKGYMTRSGMIDYTLEGDEVKYIYPDGSVFKNYALECKCDDEECTGWAMISAQSVNWHKFQNGLTEMTYEEAIRADMELRGLR